jgi:hypothetical protein
VAHNNEKLTSFDFADEILRKLARKDVFPNLKALVVAGHSAGGQFVTRYEMANQVHEGLGIRITYVVANPSAYAFLDNTRPSASAYTVSAGAPGYVPAPPAAPPAEGAGNGSGSRVFVPFGDGRNCTTYNRWPYGLENRTGYTASLTDDQFQQTPVQRPVPVGDACRFCFEPPEHLRHL